MTNPEPVPLPLSEDRATRFFRQRYTVTFALLAAILLFLLPFAQVKCGSSVLAENSGLGIAAGFPWKLGSMGNAFNMMGEEKNPLKNNKALADQPNIFALVAMAAVVAGIFLSLLSFTHRAVTSISLSLLAFLMLVALLVQFKLQLKTALADEKEGVGMILKIQFTPWYFATLFCLAAAAFFAWKHHRIELDDAIRRTVDFEFERSATEAPDSASPPAAPPA
jgi:hypothetical protein